MAPPVKCVPVITYDIGEDGKRSTEPKLVYRLVGWEVTAVCASSRGADASLMFGQSCR
jgi:hypothetical protein